MSQNIAIGPAHVLIGDPTVADGLVDLGSMESVSFDPGVQMTGIQDAFTADAYSVDGIYSLPPQSSVQVELYDAAIEKIAEMVLGGETLGTTDKAFGFGEAGLTKITTVPTLIIVPSFEAADGVDAAHQIVLPAVAMESLASIVYNRPTAGGNSANSFTATFRAARRTVDQADQAIPAKFQFAWMGSSNVVLSADNGVTPPATPWTYPSL